MTTTIFIREQPICWQEKKVNSLLRINFTGEELAKALSLYANLTEIHSDYSGQPVEHYTEVISEYSGLAVKWISKTLKKFEVLKIICLEEQRDERGKIAGKILRFTTHMVPETIGRLTPRGLTASGQELEAQLLVDNPLGDKRLTDLLQTGGALQDELPPEDSKDRAIYINNILNNIYKYNIYNNINKNNNPEKKVKKNISAAEEKEIPVFKFQSYIRDYLETDQEYKARLYEKMRRKQPEWPEAYFEMALQKIDNYLSRHPEFAGYRDPFFVCTSPKWQLLDDNKASEYENFLQEAQKNLSVTYAKAGVAGPSYKNLDDSLPPGWEDEYKS